VLLLWLFQLQIVYKRNTKLMYAIKNMMYTAYEQGNNKYYKVTVNIKHTQFNQIQLLWLQTSILYYLGI
jgi:hypothetical protein